MSNNNSNDDQSGSCLGVIPLLALFAANPLLSKRTEEVDPSQNAELQTIRLSEELKKGSER